MPHDDLNHELVYQDALYYQEEAFYGEEKRSKITIDRIDMKQEAAEETADVVENRVQLYIEEMTP